MLVTCQAYTAACQQKEGFIDEQATMIRLQPWTLKACMPLMYAIYTQAHYHHFFLAQQMQYTVEQTLFEQLRVDYPEREDCHTFFDEYVYPNASPAHLELYAMLPLPLYIDILLTLHERSQLVDERKQYKIALGQIALCTEQRDIAQQLFVCAWLDECMMRCQQQLEPVLSFDWILQYNVFDDACVDRLSACFQTRRTFANDYDYGIEQFLHAPIQYWPVAEQCLSLFSIFYPEVAWQTQTLQQIEQRFVAQQTYVHADTPNTPDFATIQHLLQLYHDGKYDTLLPLTQKLADEQHVFALSLLGKLYFKGHGVTRDLAESYYFYKEAYMRGDDEAAMMLADVVKAIAAEQHETTVYDIYPLILENTTQESITSCLIYGKWTAMHGEPFQHEQAIFLLEHAFLHGLQLEKMHAAYLLSQLYKEDNASLAAQWFNIAKQHGFEQTSYFSE